MTRVAVTALLRPLSSINIRARRQQSVLARASEPYACQRGLMAVIHPTVDFHIGEGRIDSRTPYEIRRNRMGYGDRQDAHNRLNGA